jgi:hypothetical protein
MHAGILNATYSKCVQLQHTPNQATRIMQHGMSVRVQQITPKGNHYAPRHARTAAKHGKRQVTCNCARAYSCKTRQKASNMQLSTRVQLQNTAKGNHIAAGHARTAAKHGIRQVKCNCTRARTRYLSSASCSSVSLHQRVSGKSAQ